MGCPFMIERDIFQSSNPCLNVHLIINMYGTGTLIEAPHPVSRFTTLFTFESNFLLCQMKILQSQDRQALQKPHRKTLCNVGNQIQLQCQESSLNWISGNSDWPPLPRCSIIIMEYHTNQTKSSVVRHCLKSGWNWISESSNWESQISRNRCATQTDKIQIIILFKLAAQQPKAYPAAVSCFVGFESLFRLWYPSFE